jgi:hyperosmotically inducible periplasmic protein
VEIQIRTGLACAISRTLIGARTPFRRPRRCSALVEVAFELHEQSRKQSIDMDGQGPVFWEIPASTGGHMIRNVILTAILAATMANSQAAPISEGSSARIAKETRHEILMLPYFDVFDNIEFRVDGRNVTLLGQVTRPTLKSDAENVVKGIEGIENVNNQIEVLPLSPNDDRLRVALYRAIYGFTSLQRYALPVIKPIRIIVKNGNVTLEGVVNNEADKNVVKLRANGVSGVFSVTNNLRIEQ